MKKLLNYFSLLILLSLFVTPAIAASSIFANVGGVDIDILLSPDGNYYVTRNGPGGLYKLTTGGVVTYVTNVGNLPNFMTVDSVGNIYVSNSGSNSVTKIDTLGATSSIAVGSSPFQMAVDSGDNVYVANYNTDDIYKITSAGVPSVFATLTPGEHPEWMTIDAIGNLYTSNQGDKTITKIDGGGSTSTYATLSAVPKGLVTNSNGDLFIVDPTNSQIVTVPSGGGATSTFATGVPSPRNIIIDSSDNLYTSNFGGSVSKISPLGVVSTVSAGGPRLGLTRTATGDILAVGFDGNVYLVPVAPADPANFTASNVNTTSANLSWTAPSDSGLGVIQSYTISSTPAAISAVIASPTLTYSATGLTANTLYTFTISTFNGSATSTGTTTATTTLPVVTPVSSGGGGGGGGGFVFPIYTPSSNAATFTTTTVNLNNSTTTNQIFQQVTNTNASTTCKKIPISAYARVGTKSSSVKLIQDFLKQFNFLDPTIDSTSYFGSLTKAAVIKFQEAYADDILTPWGLTEGTGYWYKTTSKKANLLMNCK